MAKVSKSWCFTLNNYTEEDIKRFKDFEKNYLVIGREIGESGTPHLQGFITFKRTYRLAALKKLIEKAHWEVAIANDAANYCMKEKYEIIDNRVQGKRNDLKDTIITLQTKGLKAVKLEHPETYVKFHSGLEKLIIQDHRYFKPKVIWLWGETGSGKTRHVVETEVDLWISGKNLKWWDGYENQEATLFDDFRKDFCTFHELLRILDRYPYTVEVKGGHRVLNSKRMYITSCFPPEEVYDTREDIAQLLRRIDNIIELKCQKSITDYLA